MNEKELLRVAYLVQETLGKLRKNRYLECVRQLSLFTGSLAEVARGSRNLGLALAHDWLAASEQCCLSIVRQLGQVPYNVSKLESLLDRRHKEVPTLGSTLAELKALQEEFDDVAFNADEGALNAVTEPITLEDVYLGPFRIALYLDKLSEIYQKVPYYIIAVEPHPAAKDEAITHPHVSNEMLCEGEGAAAIRAALEDGRLCDFFVMVRGILTTYNPDTVQVATEPTGSLEKGPEDDSGSGGAMVAEPQTGEYQQSEPAPPGTPPTCGNALVGATGTSGGLLACR
jgi:hypothetical protein